MKDFTTSLGKRACELLFTLRDVEDLDDEKFRPVFSEGDKKADFLAMDRSLIVEHKEFKTSRDKKLGDWLNQRTKRDVWLAKSWAGEVHVEELIQKHPNSTRFRQEIENYLYRNIENDLIKKGASQLKSTSDVLGIRSQRLLFITVATEGAITAEGIANTARMYFNKGRTDSRVIDAVGILVGKPDSNIASSELTFFVNEHGRDPENALNMAQMVCSRIASKTGSPMKK
ncbi:hypothetical protein HMF8227_00147 [Saliniradius amylolyticus]|uniref:Uncharacterized protein n=1 Tax=Saliniradius amylolyticus TaxID=2183582 RepID=A0A2S2DZ21_9ALTE|nr:hypothetical protein [Saliniradius amylolyticus]AWL10655.1 hypothetical protein HMF8227_00147 [Saliniradius amylolyticus]